MGLKRICDRCKAEINPAHSYTLVRIGHLDDYKEYELCTSCTYNLTKFMSEWTSEAEE